MSTAPQDTPGQLDGPRYWNPYLAGVALGIVLLSSFLVMGKGLGASGGAMLSSGAWIFMLDRKSVV